MIVNHKIFYSSPFMSIQTGIYTDKKTKKNPVSILDIARAQRFYKQIQKLRDTAHNICPIMIIFFASYLENMYPETNDPRKSP